MGYTLCWRQLPFTNTSWTNVISLLKKACDPKTTLTIVSWGLVLGSDGDCASIERTPTQITGVKTNRLPYTKDFMKALILMKEFGVAEELVHDDSDNSWWLEALEVVHAIHPLASYDQQKAYFGYSTPASSFPKFLYTIVENGHGWGTTYTTYDLAKAAVHAKYKDDIDQDHSIAVKYFCPPACDVNKPEDPSGKTCLYIEKEIFCDVYRLPIPL